MSKHTQITKSGGIRGRYNGKRDLPPTLWRPPWYHAIILSTKNYVYTCATPGGRVSTSAKSWESKNFPSHACTDDYRVNSTRVFHHVHVCQFEGHVTSPTKSWDSKIFPPKTCTDYHRVDNTCILQPSFYKRRRLPTDQPTTLTRLTFRAPEQVIGLISSPCTRVIIWIFYFHRWGLLGVRQIAPKSFTTISATLIFTAVRVQIFSHPRHCYLSITKAEKKFMIATPGLVIRTMRFPHSYSGTAI